MDSLNESQITQELSGLETNTKGISKLEKFLDNESCIDTEKIITFFRGLQDLRSAGVAHRKGKNYEKLAKKLNLDAQSLIRFFEKLLVEADEVVLALTKFAEEANAA